MLNVAQSVALDYYSKTTGIILEKTTDLTKQLEIKGKITISGKKLLRFIGKTMNIKNSIADNLYILDSPDATWENEYLHKIDTGLKGVFDLKERFTEIVEQLAIVKENLDLFVEVNNNRYSHLLEVIIIILILVEVVNMIFEKF